jgi:hypothetical protein
MVESKKKKKERLLPKPYPRAQREVIFEMESAPGDPVCKEMGFPYLL